MTTLLQHPPGTFCLRFSETYPGKIAIAYRVSRLETVESIRHYLLQNKESNNSKQDLVEFIREQAVLTKIVISKQNLDQVAFNVLPKDEILSPFYVKSYSKGDTIDGYDDQILHPSEIFSPLD